MFGQALAAKVEDEGREDPVVPTPKAAVGIEEVPIVVLPGDGVGPEVLDSCIRVLSAACSGLDFKYAEAGDAALVNGAPDGISDRALDAIDRSGIVLKGPLKGASQGERYKGDRTLSRSFALHSTVHFAKEYPGIGWPHSSLGTDLAIVSDADPYDAGDDASVSDPAACRSGDEDAADAWSETAGLAFQLADNPCWKQIDCVMEGTEVQPSLGAYHGAVVALRNRYPDIKLRSVSTAGFFEKLVSQPHRYDVLLIRAAFAGALKAVAAGLVGGSSMMAQMRVGPETVVFEPAHGPLEKIAGRDVANPMAMILAGVAMLRHLNQEAAAARVEEALWRVFRKGRTLPFDMARSGGGVGCRTFGEAIIEEMEVFPATRLHRTSGHRRRLAVVAA